jgi:hypothetical protein
MGWVSGHSLVPTILPAGALPNISGVDSMQTPEVQACHGGQSSSVLQTSAPFSVSAGLKQAGRINPAVSVTRNRQLVLPANEHAFA